MIGSCDHCYDGPCISSTKNPGYCTNKAETEICSSTGSAFVKCEVNYKGYFFLKKYKINIISLRKTQYIQLDTNTKKCFSCNNVKNFTIPTTLPTNKIPNQRNYNQ